MSFPVSFSGSAAPFGCCLQLCEANEGSHWPSSHSRLTFPLNPPPPHSHTLWDATQFIHYILKVTVNCSKTRMWLGSDQTSCLMKAHLDLSSRGSPATDRLKDFSLPCWFAWAFQFTLLCKDESYCSFANYRFYYLFSSLPTEI